MQVRQQIISMPWSSPLYPSVQLGALKAWCDSKFGGRVRTNAHSPFAVIPFLVGNPELSRFLNADSAYNEIPYMLLALRRFGRPGRPGGVDPEAMIRRLPPVEGARWITLGLIERLEALTESFLQDQVLPRLAGKDADVIGFTVSYNQVYATLYAAKRLAELTDLTHTLFLFGGTSVSLPSVRRALHAFGVPGLCVVGEGETPLAAIIETLLGSEEAAPPGVEEGLLAIDGVEPVMGDTRDLAIASGSGPATRATENLNELPVPDFDEYFERVRSVCADREAFDTLARRIELPVEGSRGCFMHCDFCGFRLSSDRYRQRDAAAIAEQVLRLLSKHPATAVRFVDNTCDRWAEEYADVLIGAGAVVPATLWMRANHGETFWTKLARAGAVMVMLGIEALSTPLLRKMRKGCTAVQNILSMKILKELDVGLGGNLMILHPRSTLEDIQETKRLLEEIAHFGSLHLAVFGLSHTSPLLEEVPEEERPGLVPECREPVPAALRPLRVGSYYEIPPSLELSAPVACAWIEFAEWYEKLTSGRGGGTLTVERRSAEELAFTDTRSGEPTTFVLRGSDAMMYAILHRGATREELAGAAGISLDRVGRTVERWMERRIVVDTDRRLVATALRPREELMEVCSCSE